MKPVIVEGMLADIDGVRPARCASRTASSPPSASDLGKPITYSATTA